MNISGACPVVFFVIVSSFDDLVTKKARAVCRAGLLKQNKSPVRGLPGEKFRLKSSPGLFFESYLQSRKRRLSAAVSRCSGPLSGDPSLLPRPVRVRFPVSGCSRDRSSVPGVCVYVRLSSYTRALETSVLTRCRCMPEIRNAAEVNPFDSSSGGVLVPLVPSF